MHAARMDARAPGASLRHALPLSLALHLGVLGSYWLPHRAPPTPPPAAPLVVTLIAPAQAASTEVVPAPPVLPLPTPKPLRRPPKPILAVAPAPTMAAAVAAAVAVVTAMPAPPAPAIAPPAAPISLSGELSLACPDRPPPDYPAMSRRRGETGRVMLRVELDEQGAVTTAQVESGSGFERLDQAALAVVKTWRCQPPRRDGRATRAVARQPFDFVLGGTAP